MRTYLSPHFTLEEMLASPTAVRLGIDNIPSAEVIETLRKTAAGMEEVRTLLGNRPINVNSGYRNPAVNSALHGRPNSQHMSGEAVDFTCMAFGNPYEVINAIIASNIKYDQVIVEYGHWVHISFSEQNRLQALLIDFMGTSNYA